MSSAFTPVKLKTAENTHETKAQLYTLRMHFKILAKPVALALAGGLVALSAAAQWQWVDKDGRKVFSDRAPPTDIPHKNILTQPASAALSTLPVKQDGWPTTLAGTAVSAPSGKASMPKQSGRDPELEARKKLADALEAAKKQAESEKLAIAKADNCERVKKGQASLKSGTRLTTTNAKGEPEVMDEAARAAETRRLESIALADCA
ncbi:MAG: hypothetical protein JWR74_1081 [Polaromonas sp.]|jgi:hypothetical protein|nr:hypothetical protein [Polaromonas sp.]